jgi:hypothetical protein
MGAGKKTTFMITNVRPEGAPHAPTHASKSLIAGRSAMRRRGLVFSITVFLQGSCGPVFTEDFTEPQSTSIIS